MRNVQGQDIPDIHGELLTLSSADPAAGAEISYTLPAGFRYQILSVQATLVTDATVANRFPALTINDGANDVAAYMAGTAQTATQTVAYQFAPGLNSYQASLRTHAPIAADMILKGGNIIKTVTTGIVAGDNWGIARIRVMRWEDPV
jgi:hypothetical protein